jgi:hypothetical protein
MQLPKEEGEQGLEGLHCGPKRETVLHTGPEAAKGLARRLSKKGREAT